MKKYSPFLVVFLILGLLLAACQAPVDTSQIDAANEAAQAAEAAVANAQATAEAAAAALAEAQEAGSAEEAAVAELQAQLEEAAAAQAAAEEEAAAAAEEAEAAAAAAAEAAEAVGESTTEFTGSLPVDVPREEVFVVDQIFRYNVAGNYNIWTPSGLTPHRHALMNETLWITDQETGERIYDAAISDPMYNDDYTQMTVELRDNIYWSDGTQFTADDLIFTVETLKNNPDTLGQAGWGVQLDQFMESAEKIDDFTVQFNLSEPNPRFHTLFEAQWNGMYMMPKHIMENVDDLGTWTFEDPVVLGAYIPIEFDPNGFWELYERRDDWEQSPAGIYTGNPGPQYVLTIFYGDSTRKAIAMSRGELDVFFDADFEAFQSVLDATPTARSWYVEFPWAYPNEINTRQFTFNMDEEPYNNKDVRWALALALDIVTLQTEYIGGVAKVTYQPVPPTASLSGTYLDPMEEWVQNLEIEIEPGEMYQPYDPTVPDRIAAWAEEQGYEVPGTPSEVFGTGWWKYDPDTAERLLLKNGFSRDENGSWLLPSGEPWTIDLQSPPDENDAFRTANAAADMWSDFGITVNLQGLERSVWEQNTYTGQYEISTPWVSYVQANGDAWPVIRSLHPDLYIPSGENANTLGYIGMGRINDPQIGEFIDAMVPINPDDPAATELNTDFLKHMVEQMYNITTISFKKFVTWDERFWTGFPTSEEPNYMPLYWFHGGKSAIQSLEPVSSN